MSEKKQIIKDVFKLTSARYLSQGLGFFTSIAMRRFLGPFYMGIWSLFRVVLDYCSYVLVGVNEGVCYIIPTLMGKNNKIEENKVCDSSFNFIFFISLITSFIIIFVTIFLRNRFPIEVIIGLFVLSVYLILDRICGYYMLLLRARKNFGILSKSIIFDSVANLILVFLLIRNFKIYGLYASIVILSIINTIFIHSLAKYQIRLNFKFDGIIKIIKCGLPISLSGLLEGILQSVDRIMIGKMIGVVAVGYYSIPIMTKSYIAQLSTFGTVLYPHLLEAYGKSENIDEIKKFVLVPPKVNAYLLPTLLGLIFFIAPLLIKTILPKFIPGILAMQILLIDMYFRSFYPQAFHFMIALKKQIRTIPIIIGAIILNIIGNYLLIKIGWGINGVALATSLVSMLIFLILQTYAMKHFAKPKEILSFILKIFLPFVYSLVFLLLIDRFFTLSNIYISTLLKCAVYILATLPLLFHIEQQTRIINIIFNIIKEKNKKHG